MDRLISEQVLIDTIKTWAVPLQISNFEAVQDIWVEEVCRLIKAIPSAEPKTRRCPHCGGGNNMNTWKDVEKLIAKQDKIIKTQKQLIAKQKELLKVDSEIIASLKKMVALQEALLRKEQMNEETEN